MFFRSNFSKPLVVVLFLFVAYPAAAQLPLSAILDSAAGQFIFAEVGPGAQIASHLLGGELGTASARTESLGALLSKSKMTEAAKQLNSRLNRIHALFKKRYPRAGEELFSGSGRVMTSAEASYLERISMQELDEDFVGLLPRRLEGTYFADRQTFLKATQLDAAIPRLSPQAQLEFLAAETPRGGSDAGKAFQAYERLRARSPRIEEILPPEQVYSLLINEEMSGTIARFHEVMLGFSANTKRLPAREKILNAIRKMLAGKVPAQSIEKRLADLTDGSMAAMERAMGDMTLRDSQILLHGGDPLKPTADSLLGQYLAKTRAATVIRNFTRGAGAVAGPGKGPRRLVVSVSEATLPTFIKLFGRETLFGHLHTPQQGTLYTTFKGMAGSYTEVSQPLYAPTEGTLIPMIVLKSTEGQRLEQFFRLGQLEPEVAQLPWILEGNKGAYCATGGYSSCTHWFGNIPIGDKLVTEYKFPGMIDVYAHNRVPNSPAPRIQKLRAHSSSLPLAHRVWKVPGNEQLAGTIGLEAQNLAGELANPGWVAHSLTGAASVDRVPVVFRFTADVRAPIAANFDPEISAL